MVTLKYVDTRPIYFPKLNFYPGGLTLPNKDNIVKVTESEARNLLKQMNGKKRCYEEIKELKKVEPKIQKEEINDNEV